MAKIATHITTTVLRGIFPFAGVTILCLSGFLTTVARAGDDTARFSGTWQAQMQFNGQMVTVISIHEGNGYRNFLRQPAGDVPAGEGTFSAANGRYQTNAPYPNNGGVYYFGK